MNILLVEDDIDISDAISEFLMIKDVTCEFAYTGDSGLELAQSKHYDVIILDLMLPNKSGYEVASTLRKEGFNTPIIMLTACDTHDDEIKGFESGVDDYVSKPCSMPLLYARMKALYQRSDPQSNHLKLGDIEIYFDEHKITRENKEIKLSPIGWKLIELLAKKAPQVVSKHELQEYAWQSEDVDTNTFNVQLHKMRKAIDNSYEKKIIHTIYGVGICLKA